MEKHSIYLPDQENAKLNVRLAEAADEPFVLALYAEARAFLAASGVDQWQDGYPDRQNFRQDLAAGKSYILELISAEKRTAAASFFLNFDPDPDYDKPAYRGLWSEAVPYAAIHRLAVAEKFRGRGLTRAVFLFAAQEAAARGVRQLRIDTHQDNLAMQRALAAAGFRRRGEIILGGENEREALRRIAYDISVTEMTEEKA